MNNEIEYIEPTQEHVGQMVEVRQRGMSEYKQRTLVAVLPNEMRYRFMCKDMYSPNIAEHWGEARVARPLTYAERQAKCGLKVGDRVRFVREWGPLELGTSITYGEIIGGQLGCVGVISSECDSGIYVRFKSGTALWLPYFVLEKVEDRLATIKDFNVAVYVDGNPEDKFKIEFIYQVPGEPFRAVVRSGDKRFVYELSNLRVKE